MLYNFEPQLADIDSNSKRNRLDKIIDLMKSSRISIHDLSRTETIDPKTNEALSPRFNMPFELGIDWGIDHVTEKDYIKQIWILERSSFELKRVLSDISGCDVKSHLNSERADENAKHIVKHINDWIIDQEEPNAEFRHAHIWSLYLQFLAWLGVIRADTLSQSNKQLIKKMREWIQNDPDGLIKKVKT